MSSTLFVFLNVTQMSLKMSLKMSAKTSVHDMSTKNVHENVHDRTKVTLLLKNIDPVDEGVNEGVERELDNVALQVYLALKRNGKHTVGESSRICDGFF